MLSIRAFVRSAPRAVSGARLAGVAGARHCQPHLISATSSSARLHLQQQQRHMYNQYSAAFSTASVRCAKPDVDTELSAKLESEIQFETEVGENEQEATTTVKDFIESGLFEVEDIPGKQDVILRRKHGDENITVSFSVADLSDFDPELYEEDTALEDEDVSSSSGGGRHDDGMAVEAGAEDAEADDLDTTSVAVRLSIVIEKPGKGALSVEATAQDGALVIDNLYYFTDASLAHERTAEASHAAQEAYPGPAFGSLDEDLQVLLDRYLEDRGITEALAVFVPEYLDAKEQREYLGFLKNLKTFVDA